MIMDNLKTQIWQPHLIQGEPVHDLQNIEVFFFLLFRYINIYTLELQLNKNHMAVSYQIEQLTQSFGLYAYNFYDSFS